MQAAVPLLVLSAAVCAIVGRGVHGDAGVFVGEDEDEEADEGEGAGEGLQEAGNAMTLRC